MKVRVAKSAGFCMGVRKAMDAALEASRGKVKTYTLGPLIHNPQAISTLEQHNVYVTEDIGDSLKNQTVVIRAHGITLEKRRKLGEVGAKIVDGTCPKVLRSENTLKKYFDQGYQIVIVGDHGHAEIEALLSYTDGEGIVVDSMEEAKALPTFDKVCVIAQTTFNSEMYQKIAEEVSGHADDSYIANTVCSSTERRQADVRKLAEETDATVVVGGKSSANTKRLAEISTELGQPTFLIEEPWELNLEALSKYNEIGVTAGASTPSWVIKEVIDSIAGYTPETRKDLPALFMTLAFFAIEGNFVLCAGASALTYAISLLLSIPINPFVILMPFFYLFPLHAVNRYLEINWKQVSASGGGHRLKRYWNFYLITATLSFLVTLIISWQIGLLTFIAVAFSYLFGGLYSVRVLPVSWQVRFRRLRDIPASKDLFIATAWTYAVLVLPSVAHGISSDLTFAVCAVFVFVTVLSRTAMLALGGIESDKLIGLETLPVFIGKKKTIRLLYNANAVLAVAIVAAALTPLVSPTVLFLLAPVVYITGAIRLLGGKRRFFSLYHQMAIDAVFFLTAVLAFLFV